MARKFLFVSKTDETPRTLNLQGVLFEMGSLRVIEERDLLQEMVGNAYDLVILDAGKISDVIQLIRDLRTRWPGLRLMVFSAALTWKDARSALDAGAVDVIAKSSRCEELKARIQQALHVNPLD